MSLLQTEYYIGKDQPGSALSQVLKCMLISSYFLVSEPNLEGCLLFIFPHFVHSKLVFQNNSDIPACFP